nr:ribonuclease H-like domain-containing protein [Tanacetum cinerariifolium]
MDGIYYELPRLIMNAYEVKWYSFGHKEHFVYTTKKDKRTSKKSSRRIIKLEILGHDFSRELKSAHGSKSETRSNMCIFDHAEQIQESLLFQFYLFSLILSFFARPDNDDINIKFLRALPSSWSQVALALKTRGGLESMSFDDLYNKLKSIELDVKIGHNYGVKAAAAPIYFAFVGASSSGSKPGYSDQQSIVPIVSQTSSRSDNIMECVLHSFVAENDPDQDMIYEDFDQTVDDKARYSAYKVTEVKTDEPKDLVSVDSMVNWLDHETKNKTGVVEKVYGMMARLNGDHAAKGAASVSDAATELYNDCYIKVQAYQHAVKTLESQKEWYHKTQIALEEKVKVLSFNLEDTTNTLRYTENLHIQAQKEKKEWEVKFKETLARFDKWKESSKNLNKLINSLMSTRTKLGLGFKQYFGEDEVFDLCIPSTLDPEPIEKRFLPLSKSFVKVGEMHEVPPSITGTFMPTSYKSDLIETQTKTNDSPTTVDVKTVPESDIEDPKSTIVSPSFSCLENVKTPRIFCNKSGMNNRNVCKNNSVRIKKCFVCGSKLHLFKDYDFYNCVDYVPCKSKAASVPTGSRNSSASVNAGRSDSAASRNRPVVNSAGRPNPAGRIGKAAHHSADQPYPAGWSKRPAPVYAGRPVSAG